MDPGRTDEAAIARDLAEVIERFRGEPRAALGVRPDADVAAVRAAFMALCKRYHPAKFARRPPATLRLANEAFWGIRRAYDELLRVPAPEPTPPPARPSAAASKTSPGFGPTRPGAAPAAARPEPSPAAARPEPRPATARPEPSPAAARPEPSPAAARPEPSPPRAWIDPSPPPPPPAHTAPSAPPGPERGPAPARTESGPRSTFDRALGLLRDRRWADARPLLVELATSAPGDVRYRAYLHYVRGWESFELGKPGEARAEWQRALACDPGLGMAQWALGKTGLG